MKNNSIIFVLLVLFPFISCTQQAKEPAGAYVDDFDLFQRALEEAHPGLYRSHSKKQFDSLFQQTRQSLNGDDLVSFYMKLASVTSFIGCGHTATLLPENSEKVKSISQNTLPFEFRVVDGRALIYKSYINDPDLSSGTELVSIEIPFNELANKILPVMRADGLIQLSKWRDMERRFSFYLQLLVGEKDIYKAELRTVSGDVVKKEIKLIPASSIPKPPSLTPLEFSILDNRSALMTVRSFSGSIRDSDGNSFEQFLSRSFKEIREKKIENLIIDVRDNGGGHDDYGSLLYSYLTDKPYSYYHYLEVNKPEFSFLSYTDTNDEFLRQMKSTTHLTDDGRYLLNSDQHSCLPQQSPSSPLFDGNVFVLINERSFSATAEFCAVTMYNKRAVFVGAETSGGYEGNNSGGNILVTLPNSKMRLYIPTYKYVSAVNIDDYPKGRGILPDHEVQPSINGLTNNIDEVMDYTHQLINELK